MKFNRTAWVAVATIAAAALAQPAFAARVPVGETFEADDDLAAFTAGALLIAIDTPVGRLAIGPASAGGRWFPKAIGSATPPRLRSSAPVGPAGAQGSGSGPTAADGAWSRLEADLGIRSGREPESEADFDSDHDHGRDHGGPSTVPLPSTVWLLGSALALFALRRWGRSAS